MLAGLVELRELAGALLHQVLVLADATILWRRLRILNLVQDP